MWLKSFGLAGAAPGACGGALYRVVGPLGGLESPGAVAV